MYNYVVSKKTAHYCAYVRKAIKICSYVFDMYVQLCSEQKNCSRKVSNTTSEQKNCSQINIPQTIQQDFKRLASIMIDNLTNAWGRFIVDEKLTRTNLSLHHKTTDDIKKLKKCIDENCHPFRFVNTFASGSNANQWILSNIGELNIKNVLLESGSYISGDSFSIYSALTTSKINQDGTGELKTKTASDLAKKHVVPLPYHIPCDNCKEKIHVCGGDSSQVCAG